MLSQEGGQEKERSSDHDPVECHILVDMRCSRFYIHKTKKQRMASFDPAGVRVPTMNFKIPL